MIRTLLTLLRSPMHMQCRPHNGLGGASVLVAFEGMYRFSDSKWVSAGIFTAIAKRTHSDQFISSGRCRKTLALT